ncbi:GTP-binding protein [Steccherinum ochraceum]|uniref:GTP-binding protein n=1 Tax=Steccherinum ochraceum TaxID=92696 RepID=A0A4R0RRF1_9APHY|nr:GTP-binding protein [Steccherinum ochraceum]
MLAAFKNLTYAPVERSGDRDMDITVMIIGDAGAGKTCLAERFCHYKYTPGMHTTQFTAIVPATFALDGRFMNIHVIDPPGAEEFTQPLPDYIPHARGIVIVFNTKDSLSNITERWYPLIKKYATRGTCQLLVRTQMDVRDNDANLTKLGREFAQELGIKFAETSAQDNVGVDSAFSMLVRDILKAPPPPAVQTKWVPVKSPLASVHQQDLVQEESSRKIAEFAVDSPSTPLAMSPTPTDKSPRPSSLMLAKELLLTWAKELPDVPDVTKEALATDLLHSSSAIRIEEDRKASLDGVPRALTPSPVDELSSNRSSWELEDIPQSSEPPAETRSSTPSIIELPIDSTGAATMPLEPHADRPGNQEVEDKSQAKDAQIVQQQEKIDNLERIIADMALQRRKEVTHLHDQITSLVKEVTDTKKNQSREFIDGKAELENKTKELSSVTAQNVQLREGLLSMRAFNERLLASVLPKNPSPLQVFQAAEIEMRAAFKNLIRSPDSRSGTSESDIRVMIIGDAGAGKTCLAERFCHRKYTPGMRITRFTAVVPATFALDGQLMKIFVIDPPGAEEFIQPLPDYIPHARGIMIVFNNEDSLSNITERWYPLIKKHVSRGTCQMLVRTQIDDRGGGPNLTELGRQLAEELGISYAETSAQKDFGVDEAFNMLVRDILKAPPPLPLQTKWVPLVSPFATVESVTQKQKLARRPPPESAIDFPDGPHSTPSVRLSSPSLSSLMINLMQEKELPENSDVLYETSMNTNEQASSSSLVHAAVEQTPSGVLGSISASRIDEPSGKRLSMAFEGDSKSASPAETPASDTRSSSPSILELPTESAGAMIAVPDANADSIRQEWEDKLKAKDEHILQQQEKINTFEKTVADMALQHRKEVTHLHEQITALVKEVTDTKKNQSKELIDGKAELEKKSRELSSVTAQNLQLREGLLSMRALNERLLAPIPPDNPLFELIERGTDNGIGYEKQRMTMMTLKNSSFEGTYL